MAIVNINKKNFEKEIGKLDEKMQEQIALFGTPIDDLGNEEEFQIEVFPNRPDLLSYHGFKRSFLSYLGKQTGLKIYKINKPEKDFEVNIDASVKNIRPHTACAIVKGLNFNDEKIKEIIEIQEKLHLTVGRKRKKLAIGIYPLEKIKLPITYKAMEPDKIKFRPLESKREMSGLEILQKHPAGKEYAHLLAGKAKFPIFIDANNQILSMPPIINSDLTGRITEKTKDVFIECSGFEAEILNKCLVIIVTTLAEIGGKIYQMNLVELEKEQKEKTPNLEPEKKKISIKNINKLLGLELNEKQVKSFLERMGHKYSNGNVQIPAWRTDVLHEVDLIEDVAIAFGYDKIEAEIPEISTIGEESKTESIKRKVSEILEGLGLIEISNYHLTNYKDQVEKMSDIPLGKNKKTNLVEIEESKTEFNYLRKDLTHYILKVISDNVDSEYPQKVFEIGKVFSLGDNHVEEKENISIAITPGNYTQIKQILEYLSKMTSLRFQFEETEKFPPHFIDGRVAEIKIKNKRIGYIGEIHPKVLRNWKIKMPVALLEINFEDLVHELI